MPLGIGTRPVYGVVLKEILQSGTIYEQEAFLRVSKILLQSSDLEGPEAEEWEAAHKELATAVLNGREIVLTSDDVVAVRDGISVIDNIKFSRWLDNAINSDLEGISVNVKVSITVNKN